MIKFDKKDFINIVISLIVVFFVWGVYKLTNVIVDSGLWITIFMLVLIFLEISDMKKKK